MAIYASQLIAAVSVSGVEAGERSLIRMGLASDSLGDKLKALTVGGVVIAGIGLVKLGSQVISMAADLEQGVNRLKTGGGDIQDSFKSLWTGIQKVADTTGILTGPLIDSMYLIVSAGQRGAQAFTTLTAAAQGAQIEQAKVKDVTQILTTLQSNFGLATYTAAQYMDGLVSAVSHGKITLEALSTAMSPILPMAHELGIHFADVSAAMSDMTNQGIPADQAATALRFTFQSMILPTKASQKAMQEWGLDSTKVAETMKRSLPDALQMYIDAAKRAGPEGSKPFIDALSQMMGGGQRAAKALFSLDQTMNQWRGDIKDVNAAMGDTSKNVAGWDTAQSNLNIKLQQGLANLQTLGQNIGMVILPYVSQLLDKVTPLIQRFDDWFVKSGRLNMVLLDIGTVLSTLGEKIGTAAERIAWLVQQFSDTGTKGQILRGVLFTIGGAVAGIKIVELGQSFVTAMTNAGAATIVFSQKLLGLEVQASTTATSVKGVGTAAAGAGTAAGGAGAAGFAGLGTAMAPIIGIATAIRLALGTLPTTAKGVFSDMGDQIDHFTFGPGGMWWMAHNVDASTKQASDDATKNMQQMQQNVTVAAQTMASNALDAMGNIKNKGGQSFADLLSQVDIDMSSIDANAKQYWANVMGYIENNPIQGHITYTATGVGVQQSATNQHYALGTDYAPGGWATVGERGPELMYVPRGASILPHNQSVSAASSGTASGRPVVIQFVVNGRQLANAALPDFVQAIRDHTGAKF